MSPQRGFALLEAIVLVAIVAIGAGGLLLAASAAAKLSPDADRSRTAASLLATQTLRVAEDAWKYGSAGNAPSGTATALLPVPGSNAPLPVTISSAIEAQSADGAAISVTVSYPTGAITESAAVRIKAPLPGTQVERPGLIPQPNGTF